MVIVTLVYANGDIQDKKTSFNSSRLYGAKLNGRRPIKAIVPKGFTEEFMHSLRKTLHPITQEIVIVDNSGNS